MVDYHIHPYYSIDAEGTVEEYCQQAEAVGLKELCFTPHFEIDPLRKEIDDIVRIGNKTLNMTSNWLDYYLSDLEAAQKKHPELIIKAGIEVGYDYGLEKGIEDMLKRYPFDFVLGSIHCIDHISFTDHKECDDYFKKDSPETMIEKYFALLEAMIKTDLFDCVGHLDSYKKYGLRYYGSRLLKIAIPYIEKAIELIKDKNLALEVNTSGLRKTFQETYPALSTIEKFKNPPILIIGSDAHRLEEVGTGIRKTLQALERMGLTVSVAHERKLNPIIL